MDVMRASRGIIKESMEKHRYSMRKTAQLLGLKSHSSLSAFINGRGTLGVQTIFSLCRILNVSAKDQRAILQELCPDTEIDRQIVDDARQNINMTKLLRKADVQSQDLNPRLPWVFETLRIATSATAEKLFQSFNALTHMTMDEITTCLQQLAHLGLASETNAEWRILDRAQVIATDPAFRNHRMTAIKDELSSLLQNAQKKHPSQIFTRVSFNSLSLKENEKLSSRLEPIVQSMLEEISRAETSDDNAVVAFALQAVELAKIPKNAASHLA